MWRFRVPQGTSVLKRSCCSQSFLRHASIRSEQSSAEVREKFLRFFESKGHKRVISDSLVPKNADPSLLFTNAGMVQFKEHYLGVPAAAGFEQLTTAQKCVRAGGKHNDLDNVGRTARHHTFFEMLGFFSFGSYGKEQAIAMAWEFLTDVLRLPRQRLRVSVLKGDQETADIWHTRHGLPRDRIVECGPADNFWSMGDGPGPCGPCTEIFVEQDRPDSDGERWLEIWNVVFMEYARQQDGTLKRGERLMVDTGMGLERLCSVLQGKASNFEIDTFEAIIGRVRQLMGAAPSGLQPEAAETAVRVIADHVRAAAFLIAEGLLPSHVGRGYVLRRIVRRAVRFGHSAGLGDGFMARLVPVVLEQFGDAYPELIKAGGLIKDVLAAEETGFRRTLANGLGILNEALAATPAGSALPAPIAFRLYDTYGFPLDLTSQIATEQGRTVDTAGVASFMEQAQAVARASWKGSEHAEAPSADAIRQWKASGVSNRFVGYDSERVSHAEVRAVAAPWLVLDPSPFYATAGGQVGDQGTLTLPDGSQVRVTGAVHAFDGCTAVRVEGDAASSLQPSDRVDAVVDPELRAAACRHHTATHLLHAALRKFLGPSAVQAGSMVAPDRLRFDVAWPKAIGAETLQHVEQWVNDCAQRNVELTTREMPLEEAMATGAMSMFSEKYASTVRVVQADDISAELCGGTHCARTSEVFPFKILRETSLGTGVRRIEAFAGPAAVAWYESQLSLLSEMAKSLDVQVFQLPGHVNKLVQTKRDLQLEVNQLRSNQSGGATTLATRLADADVAVLIHTMAAAPGGSVDMPKLLRDHALKLAESEPKSVHLVLGGQLVACALAPGLPAGAHAGQIVKRLFDEFGGIGGGRPKLGQGQFSRPVDAQQIAASSVFASTASKS
eukprot:TRINITY_DN31131_c0_g1_i1.p1 TRINITY_DN31131_c0_g1~~TRINITY_DN31131_c0_g1_i1.p1  ORF type:complete len:897 (+),score=319.04 TRINITY_DN31131_c0_g1_i1:5-2695(+)